MYTEYLNKTALSNNDDKRLQRIHTKQKCEGETFK